MAAVWRNFKFFDTEVIKGPLNRMEITSCCCGNKTIFVGDSEGFVYAVNRSGSTTLMEFSAYKGAVTHMKHLRSRNVLVTIGDDDGLNLCVMRIWALDSVAVSTPRCTEHRFFTAKHPPPANSIQLRINYNTELMNSLKFRGRDEEAGNAIPVTAFRTVVVSFDVSEDLQNAAVALVSDEIILLRGDLEREQGVKIRRICSSVARGAIAFVGFPGTRFSLRETQSTHQLFGLGGGGSGKTAASAGFYVMYTVFSDAVTVWRLAGATECTEYLCNPQFGGTPECCCITDDGQLVVASATDDKIAVFGTETVLSSAARTPLSLPVFDPALFGAVYFAEIDGHKRLLLAHRGYVLLLTQNNTRPEKLMLQCYDLQNHLRCFSRSQENSCANAAWIIADAADIFVICQEAKQEEVVTHRVVRLVEMNLQRRLEQLFQKECYDVAKRLVRRLRTVDPSQEMSIQKKYGDYLVSKGKYAEAIDQYIETIGFLEPSYVIRIFVNGQHTKHLTRYLEELHHKRHGKLANCSHTTLLLNCYIKLHDEAKLLKFIYSDDIHFDAHNAIAICRQAGYHEAALYLAEKYAQPRDYVNIQLENFHNSEKALAFIRTLCVDDAEAILREVGKDLVAMEPLRCTELLVELCVQWKGPARRLADATGASRGVLTNFDRHPQLQQQQVPLPSHRSEAKDFMHVFVDSPACLLHFLRAVVESGVLDDKGEKQRVVYNTLLEMYMTRELKCCIRQGQTPDRAEMCTVEPYEQRLERAVIFLETHAGRYDDYHALALAEQNGFEEGVLMLLQRLGHFSDIIQFYAKRLEEGATPEIRRAAKERLIETCRNNTQRDSNKKVDQSLGTHSVSECSDDGDMKCKESAKELWTSLLSILVRSPETEWQDVAQVLDYIGEQGLLSPLSVVEILSTNPQLQLSTIRDYVLRIMQRDAQRVESFNRIIDKRLQKLNELHSQIDALQTKAIVFQANSCTHCHAALDLPVVHFMCHHSFHKRCLNDVTECNLCGPAHRQLLTEQREVEKKYSDPKSFFERLKAAGDSDGFSVVAEQFGKCIFAAPKLDGEATLFTGDSIVPGASATDIDFDATWGDSYSFAFADDNEDEVYDEDGELLRPEAVELW